VVVNDDELSELPWRKFVACETSRPSKLPQGRDATDGEVSDAGIRGVLAASPAAIVGTDEDGRIALVNVQAEALFGYGRRDLIGEPVDILVPELLRPPAARNQSASSSDDVSRRPTGPGSELKGRRKDGSQFPAEISLSTIETEEGTLIVAAIRDRAEISSIARDITERKGVRKEREELGEQVAQSQRLESLGQLAGGIAHDFNNLLAVILNYASFVAEAISDNETASADIEKIRIAAERAAGLTRQLLIFSRGERIQPAFIDLTTIVDEVETLLSRTIGEQIELVVDTAPQLPMVRADRGQLEQVLVNLAVNARDAMPHGGVLTIGTDTVMIAPDSDRPADLAPGRHVTMTVSDTGIGMSPEVLAHMFEPFFTTKPRGEGSGLGLATVYEIVSDAGGTVSFCSVRGSGTTVRVYLPAVDEPATLVPPVAAVVVGGTGETVLVVEDAQEMREVTSRLLRRNGYETLEAASGEEALAILANHTCDLLLTDVIMPHMSGRDLVERVHEQGSDVPVLYMSGYSQGVLDATQELAHAVVLIQKPFDEQSLLQKVRTVLGEEATSI
jgi:hypothetical protein